MHGGRRHLVAGPLFNNYMIAGISPEMMQSVESELRTGIMMEQVQALAQQKRIGQVNQQRLKSMDGLGSKIASIDSTSYHHWGQRLGYNCWRDKQFVHEYLRDNPQAKANSGGTKIQVGYQRNVKFTKTYATD